MSWIWVCLLFITPMTYTIHPILIPPLFAMMHDVTPGCVMLLPLLMFLRKCSKQAPFSLK
jgi:hypothetical protein